MDRGDKRSPILYQCHVSKTHQSQKIEILEDPGWVRFKAHWGDNGRLRWFEKCLDFAQVPAMNLSVQDCSFTRKHGYQWTRIGVFKPTETELWEREQNISQSAQI